MRPKENVFLLLFPRF